MHRTAGRVTVTNFSYCINYDYGMLEVGKSNDFCTVQNALPQFSISSWT